jgi:hypothetical protein
VQAVRHGSDVSAASCAARDDPDDAPRRHDHAPRRRDNDDDDGAVHPADHHDAAAASAARGPAGSYEFYGYVTTDTCGLFGIGYYTPVPFTVTGQSGTELVGTHGADGSPAVGTYTPETGGWNMGEYYYDSTGCLIDTGVGVGSDYGFSAGVGATWFFEGTCPTVYCYVEATGLVYWN